MTEAFEQYGNQDFQKDYQSLNSEINKRVNKINQMVDRHIAENIDESIDTRLSFKDQYEEAMKNCQTAREAFNQLKELINEAMYLGYDLGFNEQNEKNIAACELKTKLAWSLDVREIKLVTDEALTLIERGAADGAIRYLYEKANKRREQLSEDMKLISSIGEKIEGLSDLNAKFNELEDVKLEEINQFRDAFNQILNLNKNFSMLNISEIIDERSAGGEGFTKLPEYAKQVEGIQSAVSGVIDNHLSKSKQYIDKEPKVAARWFAPVQVLKPFINEVKEAEKVIKINQYIEVLEGKVKLWDEAENYLSLAQDVITQNDSLENLWVACEAIKSAYDVFPNHASIDKFLKDVIRLITQRLFAESKTNMDLTQEYWGKHELKIIESDWDNRWLQVDTIPGWMEETRTNLEEKKLFYSGLDEKFERIIGDNLFSKNKPAIQDLTEKLLNRISEQIKHYAELINQRKEIREFITNIQGIIQEGEFTQDKKLYQTANEKFQDFITIHKDWEVDVEVLEVEKLILEFLDKAQKIKKMCHAFKNLEWNECIKYGVSIGTLDLIPLDESITEEYLSTKIEEGLLESIPAPEVMKVASVLNQLAHVHQAINLLNEKYDLFLFDDLREPIEDVHYFGLGINALIKTVKEGNRFELIESEFKTRLSFGNDNFIEDEGISINDFAKTCASQLNILINAQNKDEIWLEEGHHCIASLVVLEKQVESLWVAKTSQWKDSLGVEFFKVLSGYLENLLKDDSALTISEFEKAFYYLEDLKTVKRYIQVRSGIRRWVVFEYYLAQEKILGNYPQITKNWRDAIYEFYDDSQIIDKFNHTCWDWWLDEIDRVLIDFAEGVDNFSKLEDLFAKKTDVLPELFAPAPTKLEFQISPILDQLSPEIQIRKRSFDILRRAKFDLEKNIDNLPIVISELQDEFKRNHREEIEKHIRFLGTSYVEKEIEIARSFEKDRDTYASIEHYIRAFSILPSEEFDDWADKYKNDINLYWEKLESEVKELDVTQSPIYEKQKIANKLKIQINELKTCQISIPKYKIDQTSDVLYGKIELIEFCTAALSYLVPTQISWKKAIDLGDFQSEHSNIWNQFGGYLKGVENRLSANLEIHQLSQKFLDFKNNISDLRTSLRNLQNIFSVTDAYTTCMETSYEVLVLSNKLHQIEKDYITMWENWVEGFSQFQFIRFYDDLSKVYNVWKFSKDGEEIPFYGEVAEFLNWERSLTIYIEENPGTNQKNNISQPTSMFKFNAENFNTYLAQDDDLIGRLRELFTLKKIFLGYFLILSQVDSMKWDTIINEFKGKKQNYLEMLESLEYEDKTAINKLRYRFILSLYETWVERIQTLLTGEDPITKKSKEKKLDIQTNIRKRADAMGIKGGDLIIKMEEIAEMIKNLDNTEQDFLEKFQSKFDRISSNGNIDQDTKDAITELKSFYDFKEIPIIDALQKTLEDNNSFYSQYVKNYKPRYDFLFNLETLVVNGEYQL